MNNNTKTNINYNTANVDDDPQETQEWLDALAAVIRVNGKSRADFLLTKLLQQANKHSLLVKALNTPYCNTIAVADEAPFPGDHAIEERIRAIIRWNAAMIVVRAVRRDASLGGHIGTYASTATLYDVGFNYFWRGATDVHGGDSVYFQGHASPGIYARAFLEGRLTSQQLDNFRQEVHGKGLSSYPHPWLMPDFWQFPTVSMGLGPIQAIYQARFMRYLQARGLTTEQEIQQQRKVWCFCGDGEMDEPESTGALSIAAREQLDNLIFVVNCNLQRLDGPVRGNGKIIQELEAIFRGAGWNVIKVIWGNSWDPLFAKDKTGLLQQRMEEVVDGEYQNYKANGGAYTRQHFFGKYPELAELVADLSDDEIFHLKRGGHDEQKVYAAYHAAVNHRGQPTVILVKTVKGYGLGSAGEALNIAHNVKKMSDQQLMQFRDRFNLPISDAEIKDAPYYQPAANSEEMRYLQAQRAAVGGAYVPSRQAQASESLSAPALDVFKLQLQGSDDRKISTTMAFVRILIELCRDRSLGRRIVPIVPDEARTFGMEGLFRQLGIYAPQGQLYKPVDAEQVMFYKEAKDGQILEEGINEAGAFCSWLAAATAYSVHNKIMLPFYIFYSMFGFQRIADLIWAAGDSRARGFLLGATSGRTTLNGEGLQHEDGHSQIFAGTIPNCVSYDPTFSYELAVIIHHGVERMVTKQEDIFFYITLLNENYLHPDLPKHVEPSAIVKGLYLFSSGSVNSDASSGISSGNSKAAANPTKLRVKMLGCGAILNEVIAAQKLLATEFNVDAEVWSATSFNELARDGIAVARWNRLHPQQPQRRVPYVTACLTEQSTAATTLGAAAAKHDAVTAKLDAATPAPVIAATDYQRQFADQIREFVPGDYIVLGTDGFGRSDSRANLRSFFEVDRYHIVVAALSALAKQGKLDVKIVSKAIKLYQLDPDKVNPMLV